MLTFQNFFNYHFGSIYQIPNTPHQNVVLLYYNINYVMHESVQAVYLTIK